ncbi:MAG TPA: adenylate/guanylate cyclase domain-containing protein [Flavobacteriales bacterium]|nr:adenylate/guanylate cyclase domain-containing protein [Flavobacteriales bacterium]
MRSLSLVLLLSTALAPAFGQTGVIDSLKQVLKSNLTDSARVRTLLELSSQYYRTDAAEAHRLAEEAKEWAQSNNDKNGEAYAYKAIGMSYYYQNNWIDALVNWKHALATFREINDENGVANMLNNLGAVHFNGGDDKSALEYYLESLRLAEANNDTLRTVTALVNIGTVYLTKEQSKPMAFTYYKRALPLGVALSDNYAIGTCAVNLGEIYLIRGTKADSLKYFKPDSALHYFEMALEAFRGSTTGSVPIAMKNIGKVYAIRREFDKAIQYQTEAYLIAKATDARLDMAQALLGLADTYKQKGDMAEAIARFNEAKDISGELGAYYELQEAYVGLAKSYSNLPDYKQAYTYLNLYTDIKDTLYNAEMDKKLQAQTLSYEIEKKEGQISLLEKDQELRTLELKRQKAIRNGTFVAGGLLLLLAGGLYNRYRYTKRTNKIIEAEKERSETLLLNILPAEVAEELKSTGEAEARLINHVSVLFTDFKGFTAMSEKVSPKQLVKDLHECFSFFDRICEQYGLEKIKTIGDAYMAAGGIPVQNTTHAHDAVKVAFAMRDFIAEGKARKISAGLPFFEIRIGIHTGPVVAGIVGVKKFQYDIWGDTVNTASRMESSGAPGHVNISEATYELVKDEPGLTFTSRGKVQAKGKGEMEMYFVERTEASPS